MEYKISPSKVLFIYYTDNLKYAIQNVAYAQGDAARVHDKYGHDLLADNADHKMHQFKDICEDGNWDRVKSIIDLSLSEMENTLLKYTRHTIQTSFESNNDIHDREEYIIEMNTHSEMPAEVAEYLMKLIQEYVIDCVLEDWAALTFPEGRAYWSARRVDTADKIKNTRSKCGVVHQVKPSFI